MQVDYERCAQIPHTSYYHPEQGQHHYRPQSPPSPTYPPHHLDYHTAQLYHTPQHPPQHQQHHHPHIYERSRQPIKEHPHEEEFQEHGHNHLIRRLSQPSYVPDNRGRLNSLLNTEPRDQDYKDPDIKRYASAEQLSSSRRGSATSSSRPSSSAGNNMQVSPTGSSVSGSRSGNNNIARGPTSSVGGMVAPFSSSVTSSSRTDTTGSRTQFHAPLEPEVVAKLDDIFFKFLQRICSDLNACDSKGDHIHQPLMAKKMQRLEASTEFRPFKFRIQAFTNAFHDALIQHGLTEDILPLRKVKVYLWKHRYISRFNEDGKKQKSKGNHVWNIEARKIHKPTVSDDSIQQQQQQQPLRQAQQRNSDTKQIGPEAITAAGNGLGIVKRPTSPVKWEFREYSSRIAGQIIKFARVGVPYVYSPRIWDAQMSCPAAKFSSPTLPSWLKWHKGELKGIPGPEDESCEITVIAEYVREGEECRLEMSFPLMVSDPSKEAELMDSQNENEQECEDELEEEEYEDRDNDRTDHHMGTDNINGSQSHQHSQTQHQAHHQAAQRQLQHLKLQEQPVLPQNQKNGGRSDDDPGTSDEQLEIDEDNDGEDKGDEESQQRRKQSRERRSLLLTQETKRRKHEN
ncbi:hypothetical protein BGZ51_006822 [Haplosporangium sp. Z 767]|nr:hypothetical protein BGZ50_006855 [Haplosporangium sp. Z 11]KAF9179593.1 hypothetical protein BGZ51_006822 [Haplosporangium sp. Z 767]